MAFCVPLMICLLAFLIFYLNRTCGRGTRLLGDIDQWLAAEKCNLGPLGRGDSHADASSWLCNASAST